MRLLLVTLCFSLVQVIAIQQEKISIQIRGSFYDDASGLDLPTKIYGISKGKKKHLGQSNKKDVFDHKYSFTVEPDIESLVFESPGYSTKVIPVHFHGDFKKNAKITMSVKTLKGKDTDVSTNVGYVCVDKDPSGKLKMMHYKGGVLKNVLYGKHMYFRQDQVGSQESRYVLQVVSKENTVLSEATYALLPGVNFLGEKKDKIPTEEIIKEENQADEITRESPVLEQNMSVSNPHKFEESGIPHAYFDQGNYQLSEEAKQLLDEIYRYLGVEKKIKIKGFTDGTGDKRLNETLAKYRAQAVVTYLTNKGLAPHQMSIDWQKREESVSGENLSDYRKVTFTLME